MNSCVSSSEAKPLPPSQELEHSGLGQPPTSMLCLLRISMRYPKFFILFSSHTLSSVWICRDLARVLFQVSHMNSPLLRGSVVGQRHGYVCTEVTRFSDELCKHLMFSGDQQSQSSCTRTQPYNHPPSWGRPSGEHSSQRVQPFAT